MNPAEFVNISRTEQEFWWFRGMRKILFRLLDPIASAGSIHRVLEAGCGTGYLAQLLQQRHGWDIYPLDRAAQGLAYGRQFGLTRLLQADISSLPFPAGFFDLALCLDVLIHLPCGSEILALRELARVLAPGGTLLLRASALDVLRSKHSEFTSERQRFTRPRLVREVEDCGLRVRRCTYANSLLLPVALARFRIWERLFVQVPKSGLAPLPGWLDQMLYGCLTLESAWIGAGLNLPLGQSLLLVAEKPSPPLGCGPEH